MYLGMGFSLEGWLVSGRAPQLLASRGKFVVSALLRNARSGHHQLTRLPSIVSGKIVQHPAFAPAIPDVAADSE
jgi:hypothetical protein